MLDRYTGARLWMLDEVVSLFPLESAYIVNQVANKQIPVVKVSGRIAIPHHELEMAILRRKPHPAVILDKPDIYC